LRLSVCLQILLSSHLSGLFSELMAASVEEARSRCVLEAKRSSRTMSPVRIVRALAALLLVVVSVPAAGAIVHSAPLAGPPAPVVAVAPPAAASAAKVAPAVEASAPAAAAAPEAAAAKEVPVETMLAPDGTLRLDGTFRGMVDISGWNVTLDPENGPVFTPQGLTYTWGNLGTGLDGLVTGRVNTIAVSGTTVYIGGDFTDLGGNPNIDYIARWDGTNWSPLLSGTAGLTSTVHAIVLSGTEVIAGGAFQNAGGNSNANYLARWNGTQWTGFISGTTGGITGTVFTLALSGTHIYAGGAFTGAGGNTNADYIAYWDGGWRNLGTTPLTSSVYTIVFSGTHVYAGGAFEDAGGNTNADYIAYWNGSSWTALGGGLGGNVYAITIVGNNVYAGGDFTAPFLRIARFDGSWNPLSSGVDGTVSATLSLGGKILVGGTFETAGGNPARGLAEWDPLTSQWIPVSNSSVSNFAWNSSVITSVEALVSSGSDLYVGGNFKDVGRNNANDYVTRRSGTSFVPIGSKTVEPLNGEVETVVISGTDVYVGGNFTNAGNTPGADYIAKWDGTQWSALLSGTAGLTGTVHAIALQGNDVYVGGEFQKAGGNSSANYLARWDGSKWTGLLSGTDGVTSTVYTIAFSGTSQLFVGGAFTSTTPVSLTHIAKANIVTTTGTVTTPVTWSGLVSGTNGTITGTVYTIAISGTDVFVGGEFQNAGGTTGINYIARWDGNIWNAVGSLNAINNTVRAIARSGNDVYVGGNFTGAGGSGGPNHLARWNGSTWNAVGSPNAINNTVRAIALSGNDVYVGGNFTGAGGSGGANYVARWNGTQWTPLLSNTFGVYSNVHTIALAPNGDVYIGGVFNDTGQNPFADKVAVYKASIVTPTVTAISLGFPSPITITSLPQPLSFLVTFSEPVTGVDAADFTVVTSPTTGLTTTIASVAGSGTSYIVNVSVTGADPGSYTVGLNIPAGATITDLFNLPLGNLPFTGQTYQVNVPSTPVFKVYLSYIAR
jgi:hypothetical protein